MNDGFEIVEDGTLQEAIASDRRLTTRNIVRWVDQLIGNVLNSGKAFLSVGDFGVVDVKLGYASSLGSSIAYNEAFIAWLKLGRAIHVDKFEPTAPSNDKKLSSDNDRIAVLDFQRRVAAVQKELSASQSKKDGTRPPRGFECVKMLRFESRHDNNIVIPKDHSFHALLVGAYKEYARSLCLDLRCLGVVILQIYTLSVFSADECEKLMHWPVPAPVVTEDPEETPEPSIFAQGNSERMGGVVAQEKAPSSRSSFGGVDKLPGQRRSLIGQAGHGNAESAASKTAHHDPSQRRSSNAGVSHTKPHSATTSRTAEKSGKSAATSDSAGTASSTAKAATTTGAPEAAEEPRKRRVFAVRKPSALELSLLPYYPCIGRMPAEVKDILLNVCFTRPQDAYIEKSVKLRGEDCTRMECPLMVTLKEAKRWVHELVDKLDAESEYSAPSLWTPADERARIAAIKERKERMDAKAQLGPGEAQARLKHERYLLWYSMQSEDFREKLEARKRARKKALRNSAVRRKYIYQASFHRWTMFNFTAWVQEALLDYCTLLLGMRTTALQEKKKLKKNPPVYVTRLINDLMQVFTKIAVTKLVAFRQKRLEEDSVGWEHTVEFVRPSTTGGSKAEQARAELQSAGLLPRLAASGSQDGSETKVKVIASDPDGDSVSLADYEAQSEARSTAGAGTLPNIKQTERQRSQQRSRQRRARSAGKETAEPREPSQQEIFQECFATVAAVLSRLITQKERNPFLLCSVMRGAIAAQAKEESEAVAERILVTSEEQLYYKRLASQAAFFTAAMKQLRYKVIDFADQIDILDRGWVKFLVYLTSSAIMHQYHTYALNRLKGENYAADRLIAFFRRIVVRNIISRVWQRTNLLYTASLSPNLSSKGSSAKNSPAQTTRKRLTGVVSHASNESRDSFGSKPSRGNRERADSGSRSVKVSPQSPAQSVAPVRPRNHNVELRKPLCFRAVETPDARSLVIDLSVSIESNDQIAADTASLRERSRLSMRYEDWCKVVCCAFIETDLSEEPLELSAQHVLSASSMYVTGAPHAAAGTTNAKIHTVEQPIKRRLIIRLSSHSKNKLFGGNALPWAGDEHDATKKMYPVRVTLNVSDGVPDDITAKQDLLPGALRGRARSHSAAGDDAWDDRSIESRSLGGSVKDSRSQARQMFGRKENVKPPMHTVVSFKLLLEDILAFSCYNIQLEFDKTLADDLKDGNKAYFRYISLADENDEISVDSSDSLNEVKFAETGKQWAIRVEEDIEVHSNDEASIEAFPELEVMKVELEQYVYTRPGMPRTVKDLNARVAYSSADLLSVVRPETHTSHPAGASGVVQYSLVYQPDRAISGLAEKVDQAHDNSLDPAAHFVVSHDVADTVQGCVLLHWRHSIEDNHSNTHYEVQRRLLLISSAAPATVKPKEATGIVNRPHSRDLGSKYREKAEAPFEPRTQDEAIYIGPWNHVAGLKGKLADPRKTAASSISGSKKNSISLGKNGLLPAWTFPLHANSCTDKVSLPDELNTNPDAYNCVVGYLCACFPDLVLQTASKASQERIISDANSLASGVSRSPSHASRRSQHGHGHDHDLVDGELLQSTVPSALRIAYEYRVRAINSAGVGKFNSTSATTSLQYMLSDGRAPIKMCVVPVAVVCTHLSALRDFRTQHPKYRSHNADLVSTVLAQRIEAMKVDTETFLVEPSGDPFVGQLVAVKDASLAGRGAKDQTDAAGDEEDPDIRDWLRSLQSECPIR